MVVETNLRSGFDFAAGLSVHYTLVIAGDLGVSVVPDPSAAGADGDGVGVVVGDGEDDVDGGPLHGRLRSGRKSSKVCASPAQ